MNAFASRLPAALACLLFSLPALADNPFLLTDDELHPDVFPAVAEAMVEDIHGPDAPNGLSDGDRRRVERSLERIGGWLASDPQRNQGRIAAEQRRVNAALAPRVARSHGKSDVVCERIRPVGSNIPTTRCRSRAEIEAEREAAYRAIDRMQQVESRGDG